MEVYGAEERKEVMDVLETGALFRYGHEHIRKGMWKVAEFEAEVRKFTGAPYAHAVSSGSTAVSSILAAAGIGHGDEVIVPPYTFVAPIEAVFLAGALPVFAEIDETLCLSAAGVEAAITPKTKAVLVIHMCGAPADIEGLLSVCKKHNIKLLEDCGQAMGASFKGKSVGLHGAAGAFSFDYFKIATCGEGGMTITNSEEIYKNIDYVADHGHTHIGSNRGMEEHHVMGSNFRLGEINGAIGLAQMRKLPWMLEQNRKNKKYIKDRLKDLDGITFRKMTDMSGDSATFLNFFMPTKAQASKLFAQLAEDGVGGVANWYTNMYHFINQWDHVKEMKFPAKLAIHDVGAPQDYKNLKLPKSEEVISRLVSIGIQCTWKEEDLSSFADKLISSIKKVL
ncbi:MAG: DegT/DnrJ/EryC1/StrS family aminotransferase [Cyclobacteriaceae bacterium]|nr:DegT/DnrJ/EryC1/StrS family aminotransferase [Cyclobacteriaceae bacterium]